MASRTSLDGRVFAVTGAGSGIGRALALLLASKGAKLALADKDAAGLAETARLLGNYPQATTVLDVRDAGAVRDWIDGAAVEFGGVDGIINNAGLSVVAPFADCPTEDFDLVMDVNFGGVVSGCRHTLPHLKKSDAAWLVNVSSVFGMMGFPTQSAYNASKFAVRGLTEALYIELAVTDPQIRVIRVHPGGIKTNVAKNSKLVAPMPGQNFDEDPAVAFEKAARTTPEKAAAVIVDAMERGQHRVLIGPDAKIIDWLVRLVPVHYFKLMAKLLGRGN